MEYTEAGSKASGAGRSVLHYNLSLGARRDIRTAAPDSHVAGERASDSTGDSRKRLIALALTAACSAGIFSGGQTALGFKHRSVSFIVWL